MISVLIALLITLSTGGNICDSGTQDVDWYAWVDSHHDIQRVVSYEASEPNFWIYQSEGETVLFVFKRPVSETVAAGGGAAHGQCARLLDVGE